MTRDEAYVEQRMRLIPVATSNADKLCKYNSSKQEKRPSHHAYHFSREMVRLAEEAGLTPAGNLDLFDNTRIPPFDIAKATSGIRGFRRKIRNERRVR